MIILEGICNKFKKNQALQNLDFTIQEQELIYIHGINGCGKSTLFKIMTDVLEPDAGTCQKDANVKIGALIENPGFLEGMTLQQNMKFLGDLTNSYDEQICQKLCDFFQLDFHNHNAIRSYSVGMRQKAGIIQAVMENQNLILFDEPTRGLDKESLDKFRILVEHLIQEKKSVVIATHESMENMNFTTSYELKDGRLYKE